MVSMRHHNNVVADFEQLVKLLPPAPLRPRCVQRCPWLTSGGRSKSRLDQLSAATGVARGPADRAALRFPVSLIAQIRAKAWDCTGAYNWGAGIKR